MNFGQKVIAGVLTAGMLVSITPITLAAVEAVPISTSIESTKLSEKGDISFCEFVRAVVIETIGEQRVVMDAHYAMPYMKKVQEAGWISQKPINEWDNPITYDEMNRILEKLDMKQREKVITSVNKLLVADVFINNKVLELGELKPFVRNGNIMVPLRKTAEALGFTVIWDEENYTAHIDNNKCKTDFQIGFDSYFKASSQAIGLTQAVPLGTSPMLVNGSTYVPVKVFAMLFSYPDSVNVDDGTLSITETIIEK